MPNRIIKESICVSDDFNSLSWFEQSFFVRLITMADDFGRFDARPKIMNGRMFPLCDGVTDNQIKKALDRLATAGMVDLYEVGGKSFLQLCAWAKHQQTRATKSKYPPPPDITCNQPISNVPVIVSVSDTRESIHEIVSDSVEQASSSPPAILLPLNDGSDYPISGEQCQEWTSLYPAVDVMQQLRNMKGWLDSNPAKRKTRRGIKAFINRWLAQEQDKGRKGSDAHGSSGTPGDGEKHASQDMERMKRFLAEGGG